MNTIQKLSRFVWRFARNALCVVPTGLRWLHPQAQLASSFGRGDAEYAWMVFLSHHDKLAKAGFVSAAKVLEVGPGQNLGTALLWWCHLSQVSESPVQIVCWDVFHNACPENDGFWSSLALELLAADAATSGGEGGISQGAIRSLMIRLQEVAGGTSTPQITYHVSPLSELARSAGSYDLVYSQAAIEHIWFVESFWESIVLLTSPRGWHSHRIDLADHGRRETNYIEMLQWSPWAYWLTQRFVPGTINRWRAGDHVEKLSGLGFEIRYENREERLALPVPRSALARPFRQRPDTELLTTGFDIVVQKMGS